MTSVISPSHPSSFLLQSSTLTASMHNSQDPQLVQQHLQQTDQDAFDETYQALFCKALYDYVAQDASALSFRRGDVIEVLNQQPSGWWDGLLRDERGWFPSNYVSLISVEEAELAFSDSEYSNPEGMAPTSGGAAEAGVVDMSDAMMRGSQAQNEEWLEKELSSTNNLINGRGTAAVAAGGSQASDFWMPEVALDGRIFYVNTRTGQRSRDLPQETTDDSELAGLSAQNTVRAATGAGMVFGAAANATNGSHAGEPAGFGVPRSAGTPEPWARRLADDGMSYYYLNKQSGEVLWTRPELPAANDSHSDLEDSRPASSSRGRRAESRSSVYSDDSDVHPLDHPRPPRSTPPEHVFQLQAQGAHSDLSHVPIELTSEELIAKQLQQALTPPPPEHVTDLSSKARDAIQAIVDNVHGSIGRTGDDQPMDELIQAAVRAVRNLLYVAAANSNHLPHDLLARETRERSSSSQSPLKPAQRRVTATLSRLVLSARAMHYDSGTHFSETLNRIEADAEELERAVSSFILEVQRAHRSGPREDKPLKRLYGVFTTANLGIGLVGAGSAGAWKGFGWVSQELEEQAPKKPLGQDIAAEVVALLARVEDIIAPLIQALTSSGEASVGHVRQRVQDLVTNVSHFLSFVADIHIARHVDIDGIRQGDNSIDELYTQTLVRARQLVRTLETAVQAVYDDSSTLLLTVQVIPASDPNYSVEDHTAAFDLLDSLISSLRLNLALVRQTLDALLSVGHEQADIAQGDYNGSIEWRMSRLSMIHSQFGGGARSPHDFLDSSLGFGPEDVVDIEVALHGPGPSNKLQKVMAQPLIDSARSFATSTERTSSTEQSHAAEDSTLVSFSEADDQDYGEVDEDFEPPQTTKRPRPALPKKLISVLGSEYADKVAAESQPWYLRSNYNPTEIVIEADHTVKAGTLVALVEKLTAHDGVDRAYTRAFLMTYKSFTTLDELFDLLVQRFRTQPPDNLKPQELDQWTKLKQHIVQTRVINTFKTIIEQHVLEKEDLYILERMKDFISQDDVSKMPAAKALKSLIERAQTNGDVAVKSLITTNPMPAPTPIIPKSGKKLKLMDIDPLELARQLTIMESQLYQRIKPYECLQRAREQRADNTDNIGLVIQTSNRIADWVAHSILSKEDSRRRAQIVKHLINVADRCRTLNNFSTMIAITSGLNTPPIRRLKRTWEQVNQRIIAQFAACEVTIDSSKTFSKYRQLMTSVTPPCVPFIGVFLSTLQFIQDGNPDNLQGGLINFFKRQKASEVMDDIKQWQTTPFNLTPVPVILNFIEESLNQFTDTRASSDVFWKLSLEREPREREDEKMARLLQESGFL